MPSGLSLYWLVAWSLWAVVVVLDWRREPRDWRWVVSLAALVAVAAITRDALAEFNLRFVLLSGLAAVVIAAWAVRSWMARGRQSRMAAWARDHGFEPVALDPRRAEETLPDDLRRLPLFSRGSLGKTEGVVAREDGDGGTTLVFRHSIRRKMTWYGASGIEARGTVVAVRRPGTWLPLLQIRPAGLFDWIDGGEIGDGVPTGSAARFSKGYRLSGHEPRNLRALLPDEVLEAIAEKPGWILQGEGAWAVAMVFDRSEDLMSLKTSTLRLVPLGGLRDHADRASTLLRLLADRASRRVARDLGVA